MAKSSKSPFDYRSLEASWARTAPWHRRMTARLGLQGKLVICFMAMVSLALGASCWTFASSSDQQLTEIVGEQARQLSTTLAASYQDRLLHGQLGELKSTAQDLIKSRNILFVGFFDANFKPLALASRDPDFTPADLTVWRERTESLMQLRRNESPLFGQFFEVVAPVLTMPNLAPLLAPGTAPSGSSRLIGYVAVGVSQAHEAQQLARINLMILGLGCCIAIVSLPLAYVLVHRVFQPIRQLLDATQQIIAGDLDTRVAVHRPDVIGALARSFNDMVHWVKQQQEELAAANRDLEKRVEERTMQLESANHRLSNEIAEKEDFLRAVSHDLNAPLRNISGMATMLLVKNRDRFDEDVIHRLERIQKNVEVETDLITELLELSRIKTRRQKMEMVEINGVVHEIGELLEEDLRSRQIKLILDTQLPVLHCERARLRQIFQNLIDNAIKYMGEREDAVREIHVGCRTGLHEAEFYVRDTGMGIESDDMDKVFHVFRRGKSAQVQSVAGKGVGLASVKSIVETYGRRIWAESVFGQGSTFRFTINGKYVPSSSTAAAALETEGVGQ